MSLTNKKLSRREFLRSAGVAGLGLAGAAALGGCVVPTLTPEPEPPAAPAVVRPQMLTVWGFRQFMEDYNVYLPEAFAKAGEKHNVQVTVELIPQTDAALAKWAAAIEAGNLPDIAIPIDQSYVALYQGVGVLEDVSDIYEPIGEAGGGYFDMGRGTVEFGGKPYGIPMALSPWFTYYRTDEFDRVGLRAPFDTVDEFVEAAVAANDPERGFYSVGAPMSSADQDGNFIPFAWAFGGSFQNENNELTINTPENAAALQWYTDLYAKHKVVPPDAVAWDNASNNTAYLSGTTGVVWNPGSILAAMRNDDPELLEKTVLAPHPKGPAGEEGANAVGVALVIFNTTQFPEEARKVLTEFVSGDSYAGLMVASGAQFWPTMKDFADLDFFQEDPWNRQIAETVLPAAKPIFWPGTSNPVIGEALAQGIGLVGAAIQHVVVDGWTPEEALEEWAARAAEIEEKYAG
jgi:multiple sugar transport system substrate-binding protein